LGDVTVRVPFYFMNTEAGHLKAFKQYFLEAMTVRHYSIPELENWEHLRDL